MNFLILWRKMIRKIRKKIISKGEMRRKNGNGKTNKENKKQMEGYY
jgi:hypothetical protein